MTKDIQKAVAKYLIGIGHEAVCENFGHNIFEMDVATISKSGMLHEFEVKISRSDFISDKKKQSRSGIAKFERYAMANKIDFGCPNYFYYVCPEGLIKKDEIPFFAGLYYYDKNGELRIISKAKKLHGVPSDKLKIISKMLRLTCQRLYLGCAMLTHLNNEVKRKHAERISSEETLQKLLTPHP